MYKFSFDGKHSDEFNVFTGRMQTGFYETPFLGSRNIQEQNLPNRTRPIYQGIQSEPLSAEMQVFGYNGNISDEQFNAILQWLTPVGYKYFQIDYFNEDVMFKAQMQNIQLMSLGDEQRYINITMRFDSAHGYIHHSSNNSNVDTSRMAVQYVYPRLQIQVVGDGTVSIVSANATSVFRDMTGGSQITVCGETAELTLSGTGFQYPGHLFNKVFPRLSREHGNIQLTNGTLINMSVDVPIIPYF